MTKIKPFTAFVKEEGDPGNATDVDAGNPEIPATDTDVAQLPALFATIHHKSDRRPNGFDPEDIEQLNKDANAHLKD